VSFSKLSVRLDRRIEACNQSAFIERLPQEADGPVAKRLLARAFVGGSRDEYEGHRVTLTSQSGLQLNPSHRGHTDISDHAPAIIQFRGLKKCLCGCKCARRVIKGYDEIV